MKTDTPRTAELLSALHDETRHVGPHNCPERWVRLCRELERENARLREELDDWHNAALHVEADHPDEVHCGCVPILRRENARLREVLDPDRLIAACVPGGDICDPQQVADNIREHLTKDTP